MPENTPATIAQVNRLITAIGDLQLELAATREVVEKSVKRSRAAIVLSVISIALLLVAGSAVLSNHGAVQEITRTRNEARMVTCVQDNISIAKSRAAISESIVALAPPGTEFTPEQEARIAAYAAKVTALTPFRDCSEEGIEAYYSNLPPDPAVED